VQMILAGLRAKVLNDTRPKAAVCWHEHLPEIVHAINTQILRVHGYTPSQLFMGFNARMTAFDESVVDDAMRSILAHHAAHGVGSLEQRQYDLRIAQIAEMRELTWERVLQHQDEQIATQIRSHHAKPQLGDLVLLRRFVVDKERGRKLEPRWEGPYQLTRIVKEGVSGVLSDLKTEREKGKYGFDTMKVYLPREVAKGQALVDGVAWEEALPWMCKGWYEGQRFVDIERWISSGVGKRAV